MSGYVKELCVSSSSENESRIQLAVEMIMVGGITKGDSQHRG